MGEYVYEVIKELKIGHVTCPPTDTMIPKHNFNKTHKIIISGREYWNDGTPIKAVLVWCTDGSKTEASAEAGILGLSPRTEIRLSLSKEIEAFQAEIAAITMSQKY